MDTKDRHWLLERLLETKEQPNPHFAFLGTVNWMRALAIAVNSVLFSEEGLDRKYDKVQRRKTNREADTKVYNNLLMSFHNLASLYSINSDIKNAYSTIRSAIVTWYYCIYFCCIAMIDASSGCSKSSHRPNAKIWQADIVSRGFAIYPFDMHLTGLGKTQSHKELNSYGIVNSKYLIKTPENTEQSREALITYLKGTAEHERGICENRVRKNKDYKQLEVKGFRTKKAKELRDEEFSRNCVNFLYQAFRFRGKANYRDCLFLSYGEKKQEEAVQFTKDMLDVADAFTKMTCSYASRRVEKDAWELFMEDIKKHSRFVLDFKEYRN